jgi:hypothetical protein
LNRNCDVPLFRISHEYKINEIRAYNMINNQAFIMQLMSLWQPERIGGHQLGMIFYFEITVSFIKPKSTSIERRMNSLISNP